MRSAVKQHKFTRLALSIQPTTLHFPAQGTAEAIVTISLLPNYVAKGILGFDFTVISPWRTSAAGRSVFLAGRRARMQSRVACSTVRYSYMILLIIRVMQFRGPDLEILLDLNPIDSSNCSWTVTLQDMLLGATAQMSRATWR